MQQISYFYNNKFRYLLFSLRKVKYNFRIGMRTFFLFIALVMLFGCESDKDASSRIIFIHHSTGIAIWSGSVNRYVHKITGKGDVERYFSKYNKKHNTNYVISERVFPKSEPYGWKNYPYDYYNIWVKNAGNQAYMEEPTLEMLTEAYDVIIFKHCYPVGAILEDTGNPDINSDERRLENYILQYEALKKKMHEFQNNKFILWTPAALVKNRTTEEQALRTREFYEWMINEWDEDGDNIYLWDFYRLETEGELYLKNEYAAGPDDSHPNPTFSGMAAPLFGQFIVDVVEGK